MSGELTTIRGYKRFAANHVCEAPSCLDHARWEVTFSTSERLLLCAKHKDEVATNYARRAS